MLQPTVLQWTNINRWTAASTFSWCDFHRIKNKLIECYRWSEMPRAVVFTFKRLNELANSESL